MSGDMKIVPVRLAPERRSSGTPAERNKHSSVIGPFRRISQHGLRSGEMTRRLSTR